MAPEFEELNDLDAALAAVPEDAAEEHFSVRLMRESLARRREQVVTEANGVLDLALRGTDPKTTGAEISLVASVLGALQESLASIAQVLAGEPTSRGLIPGAIKELVQLRVAEALPGSLQLRLVPAAAPPEPEPVQQPSLLREDEEDEEEEAPLIDRSMDRLMGLLSYSDSDRTDLLQDIADVGPRATTHLQDLSKALEEAGADASLEWRSSHVQRDTAFSHSAARRLSATLEEVQEASRDVVYTGRLVGGSLVHRTFELEPEGDEPALIAGKVTEDTLADLERLFGQSCTALLEVREAQLPSGEIREAHLLKHLSE